MKSSCFILAGMLGVMATAIPLQADSQISPERLEALDERGYFTPNFKTAVQDLVNSREELAQANADKDQLTKAMPALQKQAAQAEAETVALRQEMSKYDHPEDNDFDVLQARMKDPAVKPTEQIALAQAYVWTYPTSPHQAEAQQYLEQVQKEINDARQAQEATEESRAAAHAQLLERAKAHDLSLPEWRELLRDMSQEDLLKLLGRPSSQSDDYWIYTGDWVTNPATHQKSGLQLNFNGTRVLSVDEKPAQP